MDAHQIAVQILELTGGASNIRALSHCMTRLRLELENRDLAESELLKELDAVKGILYRGESGYQIIIGMEVRFIYRELQKLLQENHACR